MNSILYVGMDVHTSNYTLCTYTIAEDKEFALVQVKPDHLNIVRYMTAGTVLFVMLSLTWVRTYVNIGLIKPNSGASCREKPRSGASQHTHLFGEIDGNPSRHCSRH